MKKFLTKRRQITALLTILLLGMALSLGSTLAYAITLGSAKITMTDPRPAQTAVGHTVSFTTPSVTAIKQINFIYCTTASGVCTTPTGIVTTGATQGSISGINGTGYATTLSTNGTMNLVVTNVAGQTTNATVTAPYTNITNPTNAGTYYLRITTYSDTGTTVIDTATVGFFVTTGQALSVTVDPALTFAINGVALGASVNGVTTTGATTTGTNTIPFGAVSSLLNGITAHDLVVTTNSTSGYSVYIKYTGTPSDGNGNSIADHSGSNTTPAVFPGAGTSAFGYTTESSTLSGTPARFAAGKWAAFSTINAEVARSISPASAQTTRIGYQVGVTGTQPAGTYTTTVVLTATPTY